jgi:hypothetical protein
MFYSRATRETEPKKARKILYTLNLFIQRLSIELLPPLTIRCVCGENNELNFDDEL